jgi:hypothetical protein
MDKKSRPRHWGKVGYVIVVRFVEIAFEAPVDTRMVIELAGGVRSLLADEGAIPLAARLPDALPDNRNGGRE